MKHKMAVLCESAIVDAQTNGITLVNLIEQINLESEHENTPQGEEVAMVPFSGTIVVFTERADVDIAESGKGRILFIAPSGKQAHLPGFSIDLSEYPRARSLLHFNGLPYTVNGEYQFIVQYENDATSNWETVDTVTLHVYQNAHEEDSEQKSV